MKRGANTDKTEHSPSCSMCVRADPWLGPFFFLASRVRGGCFARDRPTVGLSLSLPKESVKCPNVI